MKKLNLFVGIVILSLIAFGCNKKESETSDLNKQQTTKTEEKKEETKLYSTITSVDNAVENVLPNFSWEENGKTMSISEYKGKVLLINLWATWCGPCKKEIPDLMEIANDLKDKDFKMFGVSVLEREEKNLNSYLKTNPITYQILHGKQDFINAIEKATKQKIEAIPMTLIVDKKFKIVEVIVGTRSKADFMKLINKYL
ncbi:MAG: TlpA family protein disulfide reductase [Ignavibacteria bacterium]|nr:TlpA family protein disulfide reductase [Ignavibacteria bacterium]